MIRPIRREVLSPSEKDMLNNIELGIFPPANSITINQEINMASNTVVKIDNNYGWRDLRESFTIRKLGGNNNPTWGSITGLGNMEGLLFPDSTMTEIFAEYHLDHDYALGTKLYPHLHWMPIDGSVGTVRWGVEYTIAKGHQQMSFTPTITVYMEQTITSSAPFRHMVAEVSELDAITATYAEPDSVIKIRFFRDGSHPNDTFNGSVHAWQGDIHYQCSTLGTINKAPNFYGV